MANRFPWRLASAALVLCCMGMWARADWPTYRADAQRSGVAACELKLPLRQQWRCRPMPHSAPSPAWPEPGKELHRVDFDYAFQPVVAGGLLFYGSSSDDTARARDAATGELVWRFIAEGPVRFAPALAHGKAYVASDDGYLYCLDAKTGTLVWRFHAAASEDKIIGNGRVISRFPCRSGALVVGDTVYVTAGLWPTEGVLVYALSAETGKELWCNDSSGSIYIDLPHAGANGFSGVAPQGYLLVSGDTLLVPTGRSVPAAFDRHTGRLLYYKPEKTHYHGASYGGGVWCTAAGGFFFNPRNRFENPTKACVGEADPCPQDGMIAYSFATGDQWAHIPGKYRALAAGDVLYAAGNGSIEAIDLDVLERTGRIATKDRKWSTPHEPRVYCLALAGDVLVTGNRGSIAAFGTADGKPVWQVDLPDRQVRGLAISDGRLYAATGGGDLLCFGSAGAVVGGSAAAEGKDSGTALPQAAAESAADIVRRSGVSSGYALVVGGADAQLAAALAMRTELHVLSVLAGGGRAAAARERLLAAGVLGGRVAVQALEEPRRVRLPRYFADMVVVSARVATRLARECYGALRPCGGRLLFSGVEAGPRATFLRDTGIPREEIRENGALVVRGPLPGAGEWRYPWADGGRSGIGKDSRVRFPLEVLWFGGPGPDRLVDRHLMGSPPVSANGRVFMQGEQHVIGFNAYNGRELWSSEIEDVGRKYAQYYSSSLVADNDSVYVIQGDRCRRLAQETGEIRSTYSIPEAVTQAVPPPVADQYVDVSWPDVWQVIGPFAKGKPPLSRQVLAQIPERVTVAGEERVSVELAAVNGILDFTSRFGGYGLEPPAAPSTAGGAHPRRGPGYSFRDIGRICYAFARIRCPEAGKLLIGAGADWWMQWFVDGRPVFDTLRGGNVGNMTNYSSRQPCATTDWLFDVDVEAGEHVVAVMVKAGSRGWALASASMAARAAELMPVATGANPNLPNLRDLAWGYLSVADDLVLGGYNVPVTAGQAGESQLLWRSESRAVFALGKGDGALRWVYRPNGERIVANIEIAFGDGRLFLVDGTSKADLVRAKRRNEQIEAELTLVALDLNDGSEIWRQDDVPLLGDRSLFSRLKSNITHLFMGLPNWGHLVYANGVVAFGANAAYDAATGKKLWAQGVRPGKLPLVTSDRLISHPYAYELRTGEQCMTTEVLTGAEAPWRYPRAYGCGPIAGSQTMLFFRSGADGFFDLATEGTTTFGGVRSGCARSLLVANGLLIHPEGYSGCCCSYNFHTSLALVPARGPRETWYVLPAHRTTGRIKRLAVNFGAPGDRRDGQGKGWLGFPRPMMPGACPAPVTVSMDRAFCTYRRRATASVEGTDVPWVYSSGLHGQGRIDVDLVLQPNVVLHALESAADVDGELDDECWGRVRPVPFENSPFSMLGAAVDLRLFRDAESIYFGYRRGPIAHARPDSGPEALAESDELDVFLADAQKRIGIRFVVGRDGAGVARFGTVDRSRKTDPDWRGEWRYAVREIPGGWQAEVAVPLKTLTDSGINLDKLQLNCMSLNLTQSGLEGVFLTDPSYGTKFRTCVRFRRLVDPPVATTEERRYSVRLHVAETASEGTGPAPFDVLVQGRKVLRGFDVAAEAGGVNRAVVREFRGVRARDRVAIELAPTQAGSRAETPPSICGLELFEERTAQAVAD